ncbi:MAG TPA: hypothetical protein VF163_15145 [Micromonosporaceae bacterium]
MRTNVRPDESWRPGFAVRRDWPDTTHEFVSFCLSRTEAEHFVTVDQAYWRRGPWRPRHMVVVISGRDFELHRTRPECRAPDCPNLTSIAQAHPRH